MPNDTWHKHFGFIVWSAAITYAIFVLKYPNYQTIYFSIGFLFGLFMLNPDVDINSASRNAWGPLAFIWSNRVYHLRHRGIMHSPVLWAGVMATPYYVYYIGKIDEIYIIFIGGVVVSAYIHLICDFLMDCCHKIGINI
jgi:uncharacterized metal-binding protein